MRLTGPWSSIPRIRALIALAFVVCLAAPACVPSPRDCAREDVRCAGLVTDFGSVNEGIAHQAWLALLDARASGSVDRVDFIETVDTRDRKPNILAFSKQGYDVIVTVGAGITDETLSAAQEYPRLRFVGVQHLRATQAKLANYALLAFHEEESGFLAGATAALTTHTGRVAAVCESNFIDSIRRTCEGFRAGVIYVDPGIHVEVVFRPGPGELLFRDVEWGRETALEALDGGADVVFAVGEETAAAALEAAASHGGAVIGAEVDQYTYLPDIRPRLVTSATLEVRAGLPLLLQEALEGQFAVTEYWGGVGLAPFRDFESRMPPARVTRLREIASDLAGGLIRVAVPD